MDQPAEVRDIDLLLEELSDRVAILTTIQIFGSNWPTLKRTNRFIESTITRNRHEIEAALLSLLRTELAPNYKSWRHHQAAAVY